MFTVFMEYIPWFVYSFLDHICELKQLWITAPTGERVFFTSTCDSPINTLISLMATRLPQHFLFIIPLITVVPFYTVAQVKWLLYSQTLSCLDSLAHKQHAWPLWPDCFRYEIASQPCSCKLYSVIFCHQISIMRTFYKSSVNIHVN